MAVFTQTMNPIQGAGVTESIRTLDNYVRYMAERTEYSITQMERKIQALQRRVEELEKAGG